MNKFDAICKIANETPCTWKQAEQKYEAAQKAKPKKSHQKKVEDKITKK